MEENNEQYLEQHETKKPSFKSKLASAAFLIGSGAFGYNYFFDNRYPIEYEYSLISACIASNGIYSKSDCVCALKETQKEYSYDKNSSLGYIMDYNYSKCKKKLFKW